MCHLQRRVGVETLSDADGYHIGRLPLASGFVFGMGKAPRLPFRAGQDAFVFVGQINACRLAETKVRQIGISLFYAHFVAQAVEKGIG